MPALRPSSPLAHSMGLSGEKPRRARMSSHTPSPSSPTETARPSSSSPPLPVTSPAFTPSPGIQRTSLPFGLALKGALLLVWDALVWAVFPLRWAWTHRAALLRLVWASVVPWATVEVLVRTYPVLWEPVTTSTGLGWLWAAGLYLSAFLVCTAFWWGMVGIRSLGRTALLACVRRAARESVPPRPR